MNQTKAEIIKQMIDNLDHSIITAKQQSLDFVAQLLDMARLELLTGYHAIEDREFNAFCKALKRTNDQQPTPRKSAAGRTNARRSRDKSDGRTDLGDRFRPLPGV